MLIGEGQWVWEELGKYREYLQLACPQYSATQESGLIHVRRHRVHG